LHASAKSLKVHDIIDGFLLFHVPKNGHTDDGVNESDKSEQRTDVEQCRQGNDEGKQQLPYPFGGLKY